MEKYNLKNNIKNALTTMLGITIGFGWVLLCILIDYFKDLSIIIPIGIYLMIIFTISLLIEINDINKKINEQKTEVKNVCNKKINEIQEYKNELTKKYNDLKNELNNEINFNKKILEDEKIYKPYLAEILANYYEEIDTLKVKQLETKKNPAQKGADEVRTIKIQNKELRKKLKTKEYQLIVYENLFPWLEEFKEMPEEEIIRMLNNNDKEEYDKLKEYLSPEEYNKLPDSEKYQLWLDRYKEKKKKSPWEIGRDFERYVGYKYENDGYKVIYNGAKEGLEDLGRDLIASKDKEMLIIQCKYWNREKTIHEKHIFQLYGTMILKSIEEPNKKITGIFICTNTLSQTAKKVAEYLKIKVLENYKYNKNYPLIKCNISDEGEKIYHLPFDQQYDNISIETKKGECYVETVEEAEKKGFRKALKHNFYK